MRMKKSSCFVLIVAFIYCLTLAACGGGDDAGGILLPVSSGWSHQAYLKPPNNSNADYFGSSVAVSGDTIVVGAYGEDSTTTTIINGTDVSAANNSGNNNGAAYVFVRSGNAWTHQAYLKPPNNSNEDNFGNALAVSGDTIVVGAYGEDSTTTSIINGADLSTANNSGLQNGAAYVFVRSGNAWAHQAYLKPPNNSNEDLFGYSVAVSGDTIVVGAHHEDSSTTTIINGTNLSAANDSGFDNGAAYVFVRSGSTWSHQAYLKPPNNSNGDLFGNALALSGDTIVVGAYFEDSSTTSIINGTDLSAANNSGYSNGAAYVFVRSGTTWTHQAYLKPPNNSNADLFGSSVALSGDTIVVGAYFEGSTTTSIINGTNLSAANDSGSDNGAAYVFVRSGTTWSHQAYLKSPNNSNADRFGSSVAVSGDTIVVGAYFEDSSTTSIISGANLSAANDSGSDNGAAYVFVRYGNTWAHQAYLKSPNNSNGDLFGYSVAVSGDTIVVGARLEDSTTTTIINGTDVSAANDSGANNGAAYVFVR